MIDFMVIIHTKEMSFMITILTMTEHQVLHLFADQTLDLSGDI